MSLALVIDRFTRAVEAWRMDGTDRVSAGNTTPRELPGRDTVTIAHARQVVRF